MCDREVRVSHHRRFRTIVRRSTLLAYALSGRLLLLLLLLLTR